MYTMWSGKYFEFFPLHCMRRRFLVCAILINVNWFAGGTFASIIQRGADLYVSAGSVPAAEPWHRLPRPEYVGWYWQSAACFHPRRSRPFWGPAGGSSAVVLPQLPKSKKHPYFGCEAQSPDWCLPRYCAGRLQPDYVWPVRWMRRQSGPGNRGIVRRQLPDVHRSGGLFWHLWGEFCAKQRCCALFCAVNCGTLFIE